MGLNKESGLKIGLGTPGKRNLITDVPGVKKSIVYPMQDMLRKDVEYVGAHPMAGREVSGVENADMRIFEGANYIVTPTEQNTAEAIEACMRHADAFEDYPFDDCEICGSRIFKKRIKVGR